MFILNPGASRSYLRAKFYGDELQVTKFYNYVVFIRQINNKQDYLSTAAGGSDTGR